MVISTYKYVILAFLGLGCLGAYPIYQTLQIGKDSSKTAILESRNSLEIGYKAKFEQERIQILEAIRQEFGISKEVWNKGYEYYDQVCANSQDLFLDKNTAISTNSDPLINRIRNLLVKNGINPDKVSISFNAEYNWPVATRQRVKNDYYLACSIDINTEWFNQQPIELQDAIISHEIMHLKHFDCFEYNLILGILEENGISAEQYQDSKSIQKYRHMRELRADLMASLNNIEVAKALHDDFCNCVAAGDIQDLHEHPSNQVRMNQMAQLMKELQTPAPIIA